MNPEELKYKNKYKRVKNKKMQHFVPSNYSYYGSTKREKRIEPTNNHIIFTNESNHAHGFNQFSDAAKLKRNKIHLHY